LGSVESLLRWGAKEGGVVAFSAARQSQAGRRDTACGLFATYTTDKKTDEKREREMKVKLKTHSTWRLRGTD